MTFLWQMSTEVHLELLMSGSGASVIAIQLDHCRQLFRAEGGRWSTTGCTEDQPPWARAEQPAIRLGPNGAAGVGELRRLRFVLDRERKEAWHWRSWMWELRSFQQVSACFSLLLQVGYVCVSMSMYIIYILCVSHRFCHALALTHDTHGCPWMCDQQALQSSCLGRWCSTATTSSWRRQVLLASSLGCLWAVELGVPKL